MAGEDKNPKITGYYIDENGNPSNAGMWDDMLDELDAYEAEEEAKAKADADARKQCTTRENIMTTLEQINEKINTKLAELGFDKIKPCGIYSLDRNNEMPDNIEAGSFWNDNDKWPCSDEPGIYAIFSGEELLYIGESSKKIGPRLSSYFKEGKNGKVRIDDEWRSTPTHVVTWAVLPEVAYSPLLELEEFLISELNPCDNTQHRSN